MSSVPPSLTASSCGTPGAGGSRSARHSGTLCPAARNSASTAAGSVSEQLWYLRRAARYFKSTVLQTERQASKTLNRMAVPFVRRPPQRRHVRPRLGNVQVVHLRAARQRRCLSSHEGNLSGNTRKRQWHRKEKHCQLTGSALALLSTATGSIRWITLPRCQPCRYLEDPRGPLNVVTTLELLPAGVLLSAPGSDPFIAVEDPVWALLTMLSGSRLTSGAFTPRMV